MIRKIKQIKIMKNLKVITLAIAILGFSAASFAQVTATATAKANIITPIAISKTVDMNFGNVAVNSTTAGTVVLTPAGTRTQTGGVTLPATKGTVTAAQFYVIGESGYTFAITLPTTDLTITNSTSETMTVNTFTSTPSGTGTLSGSGEATFNVGATLNVAAGQTAGLYKNETGFKVTVNYN